MLRGMVWVRRDRCVQWGWKLPLALWIGSLAACGPIEPGASPEEALSSQAQGLEVPNGFSINGLSINGLSVNGLSVNGLSTAQFSSWFNGNPQVHETVMAYVVRCAMTKSQSLAYYNPVTGKRYRWKGQLGLAPRWSTGYASSVPEQQLVSACLAAHVNKFGLRVSLSVLGASAQGKPLSYTSEELALYSMREACFFGNLFNGDGLFVASDRPLLRDSESSSRACGLRWQGRTTDCTPMAHVGFCSDFCTRDASGTYYTQCTYQGTSFLPITTRIQPREVFQCGDGVCQLTEQCGSGSTPESCSADCGACP